MLHQSPVEVNVQIAVVKWHRSNGWTLEKLSVAHGQGIDSNKSMSRIEAQLTALGIPKNTIEFASKGEDIRARQEKDVWRIECKGFGTLVNKLRQSTLRNHFDRALASTVSYYNQTEGLRLGLAVPEQYASLIRDRVPRALRMALNLWILLYVSADDELLIFEPPEELPL